MLTVPSACHAIDKFFNNRVPYFIKANAAIRRLEALEKKVEELAAKT